MSRFPVLSTPSCSLRLGVSKDPVEVAESLGKVEVVESTESLFNAAIENNAPIINYYM